MRKFSALFFSFLIITVIYSQIPEQSALEKIKQQQTLQGGTLTGKIHDEKTGEDLIGASVSIINTKLGASTDIDGRFEIKRIPEGTIDIRISFIGYESKVITGISIKLNEQTSVDVSITEDQGIQQQEVVISAEAIKSGEGAILAERKKAAAIGDGISIEQIKKAPDATSGDALKRVTGVTLVDNKFVFVRGVTDRYNQTTLNGASVPSTSVDKKSFSFDMLPSNLLDNMNVVKTATPDLPGDFTGGLVQLNTMDFPESRSIKFVTSGSFNSITTTKSFNRSQGGSNDWIGSDDGIRNFPAGYNSPQAAAALGSALPNTWASRKSKAPISQSASLSIADKYLFGEDQFGFLAALSFRNNYQRTKGKLNEYVGTTIQHDYADIKDQYSVLWGAIFDLNYKTELHKFTLKNNYNKAAEDKYILLTGHDINYAQYLNSYLTEWEQRGMLTNQISGEHVFPQLFGIHADWMVYFSQASTDQPDRKQLDYNHSDSYGPDEVPYEFYAQFSSRSWAKLYDRNIGEKINISIPVENAKIKIGILNDLKNRHYDVQYYQININNIFTSGRYDLLQYGPDSIFNPENFSSTGFSMVPHTKISDKYHAKHETFSGYLMGDVPFSIFNFNFRFTGGVRIERSTQNVYTTQTVDSPIPIVSSIAKSDILPSVNFTYIIDELQNLRIAYSQTVNRPEFREMANIQFYDFDKYEYVEGNPNLTRAIARNYDIRYEIFPDIGDLFALSYFYKSISHPIEERLGFSGFRTRKWLNAEKAKNFGWEIEIRKNFGFIGEYFRNVQFVGNYSRIFSEVPYNELGGSSGTPIYFSGVRAMQGQSPYMYNISVFFVEPNLGTSINVLYNEFGSRIDAISDITSNDLHVYEKTRGVVDFSITQPLSILLDGFELKYTVKNLNNQPIIFTHGDKIYRQDEIGINHSLQISYNF